ncbi:MAG: aminopeptidase [Deltaproteobacteria bacterium]|nr:aminopeptidase [Deltaproteobacteria bacterium]
MRLAPVALIGVAVLCGCGNLGYYLRSARGQTEVLDKARPLDEVVQDPSTSPELRARLQAVARIREFASRDLGLPDGPGFRTYTDLGRPYVVWNVHATPELSLTPRQWCFPVAGCVTYRGYFSETEARAFAAGLEATGDDVYVGGVATYSTLGWFDDPVLNTFVGYPEPDLARLIFHELAHRVAYAADDTVWNESFATAVELEGVQRWLARFGTEQERVASQAAGGRREDFRGLLARCRSRLAELYASGEDDEAKRRGKAAIFGQLQAEYRALREGWGGYGGYDAWFARPLNNAHLASAATYTELVPRFQALLQEASGDLPRFYATVRRWAALPKRQRLALLSETGPVGADAR